MALIITTWLWGNKYGDDDVRKLRAGISRHLKQEHRFLVAKPQAEDDRLTKITGCFCRLRMFDPEWQKRMEIEEGDRIVCIDLDVVVTGDLDALFNRPETFMILLGANSSNPNPMNGSLVMLRAGHHQRVWSEFSIEKAKAVPHFEFPDDQAWLHHMLPGAAGWSAGPRSGVYSFKKTTWPAGDDLPPDAILVVFPGWRSPAKFAHLSWVKKHWS